MIPRLDVVVDLSWLTKQLDLQDKQTAFAVSKTIKDLTWLARGHAVESMKGGRFTLRRNWILQGWRTAVVRDDGSVRYRRASRREFTQRLFHLDRYMGRQEHGGAKTPVTGSNVAVPGKSLRPAGPAADPAKIRKDKWPSAIMATKRGFVRTIKGDAVAMLERRVGTVPARRRVESTFKPFSGKRGKMWKSRGGIFRKTRVLTREARVRYILTPRADVRPRLGLVARTRELVNGVFWQMFQRNYAEALRTAK